MELRVRHKEGYYKWVEAAATNFLSDPSINAIVVNFHDIAVRKELELRNDFISLASHELKTPITYLKAYSQILISRIDYLSIEKIREYVSKMNLQVDQMARLVEDLLDVTRI